MDTTQSLFLVPHIKHPLANNVRYLEAFLK